MKTIDLRSDTVTKPTSDMRSVMASAEVGDDVYGEDPTVNHLERMLSERVGMEAGLFLCSGTQSNLLGIMSHCERGDEYIAGQEAHLYKWEGGGAAILGSIQPQPVELEEDGTLCLELLKKYIKPESFHFARTRLLCLENTQAGKVLPLDYLERASSFAKAYPLGLHLDGARIFNAAVKLGVDVQEITKHFDSVSICLSKGLGTPVGSVLCGSTSLIAKARRWRKVLGGGMRQAGILAAAGIYALKNHVNRLSQDHDNARALAEGLSQIEELEIDWKSLQTNMVFVRLKNADPNSFSNALAKFGILVPSAQDLRLVTHLDVSQQDIPFVVDKFKLTLLQLSKQPLARSAESQESPGNHGHHRNPRTSSLTY